MELRHLRYFCAVAEEKNMTRAAEKIFMAQPPLTRQIKQLEEEVGVQLIQREARGITLTPAGEYFWKQAQLILEKLASCVEESRRIDAGKKRIFRIGFVPSIFYGQLPQLVRRLRQQHKVDVELHEMKTGEQIEALKSGKIDMGFGRVVMPSLEADVTQKLLFSEPILAALPIHHPLANDDVDMAELATLPLITYPGGKPPTFANICLDLFASRGLRVRVAQQVNDIGTALGLVSSDMGFTLVPEQVMRTNRDGVAFVRLKDDGINSPVFLSKREEPEDDIMAAAMLILDELVQNRIEGRYP